MDLKVVWVCDKEPRHARIENVDIDVDEGEFENKYVSISGYFGDLSPKIFAAAPDLYEALEEIKSELRDYSHDHPVVRQIDAALTKARGQ
jgi:hypothetical protein